MRDRIPFGYFFLAGFLAGIMIISTGKSSLLDSTGLLGESALRQLSAMNPDGRALFVFVSFRRGIEFLILALLATTYLGVVLSAVAAIWYGFSFGSILAAGMMRYGLKGIFLILSGIFPHYMLYVPVFYALLRWCEKTCRMIYRREMFLPGNAKTPVLLERVLSLLLLFGAMLVGCALESFVNPVIFRGFIKLL